MKTLNLFQNDKNNIQYKDVKAVVNAHKINDHFSWIEVQLNPQDDVRLQLNDTKSNYVHFMYNLDAPFSLQSLKVENKSTLSKFQSAIMHDKGGLDPYLYFKAQGQYQVYIVQLEKYNGSNEINNLFSQFEAVFNTMSKQDFFIHTGLPNLQLGEYVKKLIGMPKVKLSDKLMASGYINILLSIKLKQYLNYVYEPVSNTGLSKSEMERIKQISSAIEQNPEMNYTIEDLCREVGMSAAKLQLGFKEMHGTTVCNYISNVRLEKAEIMLKTTELNVSQIVYSLGWTSRSYFCKIFKEKYQCSPKNYQSLLLNAQ